MPFFLMVRSLFTLPLALLRWVHRNVVAPENDGKPLPPIRYDDDPRDIYLA